MKVFLFQLWYFCGQDARSKWGALSDGTEQRGKAVADLAGTALPPDQARKLKRTLMETTKMLAVNRMKEQAAASALQKIGR